MANITILDQMSTGDVIDRSVRLYRRNFVPLVLIVSVPSLLYYFASVTFLIGYTELIRNVENPTSDPITGSSMALMMMGMVIYPVWFFVMLFTVSGLSRVVGDHIMLGEPITFRKCFSAARKRFGDIFVMGLLSIVAIVVLYFVLVIVVFIAIILMGLMAGGITAARLPPWVAGAIITILALLILAGGIFILLYVLARIAFMPQIVMIEGYKAGHAIGRAIRLGKANWHRVGAIMLFVYFVSLSLLAAFSVPALAIFYLLGMISEDFFLSPTWNVISTSFNQISNLLVLPLWVISFTLLYFDNRVRKEGYDLELLARDVAPGFHWQPVQPAFQNYPSVVPPRPIVQTSPLGLAGYGPLPRAQTDSTQGQGTVATEEFIQSEAPIIEKSTEKGLSDAGEPDKEANEDGATLNASVNDGELSPEQVDLNACSNCGNELPPQARFCNRCGAGIGERV